MAQPLDIAFVVPGLPFNGNSLNEKGLGGSETAAIYMAKALKKLGNRVTVFSSTDSVSYHDGVLYMPIQPGMEYIKTIPHDVTIVQRHPEIFSMQTNSKLNVLWAHDLAFKRNDNQLKSAMWNIDKIFNVSEWHKKQWQSVYGLENKDDYFWATRNGIDIELINQIRNNATGGRDKFQLVYGARPERGLDVLIDSLFEKILQAHPECRLVVPTYDVGLPQMQEIYNNMFRIAKQKFGDKFESVGSLTKQQLYNLYSTSGVYIYPTPGKMDKGFREVSCISVMEAMACGLPVVSTKIGALPETLAKKAGILIDGDTDTVSYQNKFVNALSRVFDDQEAMGKAGIHHAQLLSWDSVAKEWHDKFIECIKQNNNNKERLFNDLWRHSDVMAARELMPFIPDNNFAKKDIQQNYPFLNHKDYAGHYEKWDVKFMDGVVEVSKHQHRYKLLEQWAVDNLKECKSVLDFACHDGGYTTNLAKILPNVEFRGVDFNQNALRNAEKEAQGVSNVRFYTPEQFKECALFSDLFDVLLMQEVLEHVEKPWELVNEQEQYIEDGGKVYITVPYGPWEYDTFFESNNREHIWHFDRHDLFDMFGDKKDLNIGAAYIASCLLQPVPRGWWIVTYTKTQAATNPINMERKLWLQRPRQTVSLNVMAGKGSGKQSRWMLDSVKYIVDQYVVADTGMDDVDIAPWKELGATIVKAPDPKIHGFETPRNIGLEHCTMDNVLWIDTDEHVTDATNIIKYLRKNVYDGYGIRQHHFAVDTTFPPDMPVRLFRRERDDGKQMRFVGMVHEHPETGVNEGPGLVIVLADVNIAHTGYLAESGRKQRFFRNLGMLSADSQVHPDRLLGKHFVMRDSIQLARYHLMSNGGQVTPDIVALCRDTIRLYQENFIGKNVYQSIDSQAWYSQALEILNEGFWVDVVLNVTKDSASQIPQTVRRKFASIEDLEKELQGQLKDKTSQFIGEYQ